MHTSQKVGVFNFNFYKCWFLTHTKVFKNVFLQTVLIWILFLRSLFKELVPTHKKLMFSISKLINFGFSHNKLFKNMFYPKRLSWILKIVTSGINTQNIGVFISKFTNFYLQHRKLLKNMFYLRKVVLNL